MVCVTLERRVDAAGNTTIHATRCALCGEPLPECIGLSHHIRNGCDARELYAQRGVLRDGGPDTSALQEATNARHQVATDGGEVDA